MALAAPDIRTLLAGERLALVTRIEWYLLVARYLGYTVLLALYAAGFMYVPLPNLWLVTLFAVIQHAFVHYVFYTQQYHLFQSPYNFFMHWAKVTALVALTGGTSSYLVPCYYFLLIGYIVYAREFRGVYVTAFVSATGLATASVLSWISTDVWPDPVVLVVNILLFIGSAWLLSGLGELTREFEIRIEERTQDWISAAATLRAVLDRIVLPVFICDDDEMILDCNEAAAQLLKRPRTSLLGMRFRAFFFDDGTLPWRVAQARHQGEYQGEAVVLVGDTDERTVTLYLRSYVEGNRRRLVLVLRDMTSEKEAQAQMAAARAQIKEAQATVRRITEWQQALHKEVLIPISSPFSAVVGYAHWLRRRIITHAVYDDVREAVIGLAQAVQAVETLMRRLKEMAGYAAGNGGAGLSAEKTQKVATGPPEAATTDHL